MNDKIFDIPAIAQSVDPDIRIPYTRMREAIQTLTGAIGDGSNAAVTARRIGSGQTFPGGFSPAGGTSATAPDATPPPTVTNFRATAGFSQVVVQWDAALYTQGHGPKQTNLYGVKRSSADTGAAPTFGDAQLVDTAMDALTIASLPSDLGITWHLWAKFETVDGIESIAPAGGVNGVIVTTGQDIAQLLKVLTGQITASQLYAGLGSRINLIDGASTVPGSVDYRLATTAADLTSAFQGGDGATYANAQTYVQGYAYSKSTVDGAFTSQFNSLTANYQSADQATLTSAQAFVQTYAYSKASADTAVAQSTATAQARIVARVGAVLNSDPGCTSTTYWPVTRGVLSAVTVGDGVAGNNALELSGAGSIVQSEMMDCAAGRLYRLSAWARVTAGTGTFYLRLHVFNAAGQLLTYNAGVEQVTLSSAWARLTGTVAVVGGGVRMMIVITSNYQGNGTTQFQDIRVEDETAISAAVQTESTARVNADGTLFAQYTVKLDVNGYVSGYGLASTSAGSAPTSSFIVRADSFAIASPSGPGISPATPFVVRTTVTTENGVSIPVGVFIDAAYIVNVSALYGRFGSLVADSIAAARIDAAHLTLGDGTVGGNLKSANYAGGSTGWLLRPDGYAEFSTVVVRGTIFASAGTIAGIPIGLADLRSSNYVPGTYGYRMNADGSAEFNNIFVRGTVYANAGSIGGIKITQNYVETNNYVYGSAGWSLNSDGSAWFNNITARGNITANSLDAATGTFTGSLSAARISVGDAANATSFFDPAAPTVTFQSSANGVWTFSGTVGAAVATSNAVRFVASNSSWPMNLRVRTGAVYFFAIASAVVDDQISIWYRINGGAWVWANGVQEPQQDDGSVAAGIGLTLVLSIGDAVQFGLSPTDAQYSAADMGKLYLKGAALTVQARNF